MTLFDPTCPARDFPHNYWQNDVHRWLQDNQLMAPPGPSWDMRWQQVTIQVLDTNRPIIPAECFKHARIDTFSVNYRDILISVRGPAFNRLLQTEAFGYLLGATGIHNDRKPIWIAGRQNMQVPDCTVIVWSTKPRANKTDRR